MRAIVAGIEHFMNLRRAPVQCDECNTQYTHPGIYSFGNAEDRARYATIMRDAGWLVEGDHERHVCPDCVRRSDCPPVP